MTSRARSITYLEFWASLLTVAAALAFHWGWATPSPCCSTDFRRPDVAGSGGTRGPSGAAHWAWVPLDPRVPPSCGCGAVSCAYHQDRWPLCLAGLPAGASWDHWGVSTENLDPGGPFGWGGRCPFGRGRRDPRNACRPADPGPCVDPFGSSCSSCFEAVKFEDVR